MLPYTNKYRYVTVADALHFSNDLKLAHYVKIPPRHTYMAQVAAVVVSAFVATGVMNFQMTNIPNLCERYLLPLCIFQTSTAPLLTGNFKQYTEGSFHLPGCKYIFYGRSSLWKYRRPSSLWHEWTVHHSLVCIPCWIRLANHFLLCSKASEKVALDCQSPPSHSCKWRKFLVILNSIPNPYFILHPSSLAYNTDTRSTVQHSLRLARRHPRLA